VFLAGYSIAGVPLTAQNFMITFKLDWLAD